jgi:pimeloyl-ACP methyl ester carboxylesterase
MDYYTDFSEAYAKTRYGKVFLKRHISTNGIDLVFLHGLGGTTKVWLRLLSHIGAEFGVILIDLLGHGMSDTPDINYDISQQAEAVNEAVATSGAKNAVYIGHSYGGWVAAITAVRYGATTSLVLIDSAGLEEHATESASDERIRERKKHVLSEISHLNRNKEEIMWRMLSNPNQSERLSRSVLGGIKSKTLIIWGEDDQIIPIRYAELLKDMTPNSTLAIIPGARHNPHYTNPERVASIITSFIKSG